MRTLKSALDARYKAQVHPRHPVLCWMVDYAGSLITRFNRGSDGRTPYERLTGKKWNISLPEFGECVFYKPLKGEEKGSKMEPRFYPGVFLGLQEATGLRWIGTDAGIVRTWTIKRKPVEEQWVMEELDKVIGLPWQLKPSAAPDGTRAGAASEKEIRIELAPDDASVPKWWRRSGRAMFRVGCTSGETLSCSSSGIRQDVMAVKPQEKGWRIANIPKHARRGLPRSLSSADARKGGTLYCGVPRKS